MDALQIAMVVALSVFLLEGFVLAVFPGEFQRLMARIDPSRLRMLGLVETIIVLALIGAVLGAGG